MLADCADCGHKAGSCQERQCQQAAREKHHARVTPLRTPPWTLLPDILKMSRPCVQVRSLGCDGGDDDDDDDDDPICIYIYMLYYIILSYIISYYIILYYIILHYIIFLSYHIILYYIIIYVYNIIG